MEDKYTYCTGLFGLPVTLIEVSLLHTVSQVWLVCSASPCHQQPDGGRVTKPRPHCHTHSPSSRHLGSFVSRVYPALWGWCCGCIWQWPVGLLRHCRMSSLLWARSPRLYCCTERLLFLQWLCLLCHMTSEACHVTLRCLPKRLLESSNFFRVLFCFSISAISWPPSSAVSSGWGKLTQHDRYDNSIFKLTNQISSQAEWFQFRVCF